MGGGRALSEFDQGQVVGARKARCLISATAKLLGILRENVASMYQVDVKCGKTANSRMKCGRKRALNDQDLRRFVRIVQMNRKSSFQQIASQFNEGAFTSLCAKIISRHMVQTGWGSRRPHPLQMLTARPTEIGAWMIVKRDLSDHMTRFHCIAPKAGSLCGVNHAMLWTLHAKFGYNRAVQLFGQHLLGPARVPW